MTVLRTQYDVLLLDLDGTLYAGAHAIPGTQAALGQGTQALYYVTNNASRSPSAVSAHLTELGFDSEDDRVVTSSQTAVRLLAERLEPGAAVLVVGTDALADEVTRVGLLPVREFADSLRLLSFKDIRRRPTGRSLPRRAWRSGPVRCG